MPRQPAFQKSIGNRCKRCEVKYAQDKSGLCRQCYTIEFGYKSSREREAERVIEQRIKDGLLERRVPPPPGPKRTYWIRGVEFEVVWDGT